MCHSEQTLKSELKRMWISDDPQKVRVNVRVFAQCGIPQCYLGPFVAPCEKNQSPCWQSPCWVDGVALTSALRIPQRL